MTLDEALNRIRQLRPQAQPNENFMKQLKEYELSLVPKKAEQVQAEVQMDAQVIEEPAKEPVAVDNSTTLPGGLLEGISRGTPIKSVESEEGSAKSGPEQISEDPVIQIKSPEEKSPCQVGDKPAE